MAPRPPRRTGHWLAWLAALLLCTLLLASGHAVGTEPVDPELRQRLIAATAQESGFADVHDAEVWLIDMSGRLARWMPDPLERMALLRLVHREAVRVELPPEMVLAVIQVESAFDRWAISVVGARGLMQIMPFWVDEIGRPDDNLFDLETNLRYGTTILRHYYDIERGDWFRALGRYNGSLGSPRYPHRVFTAYQGRWLP